jgi:hypothetical protein
VSITRQLQASETDNAVLCVLEDFDSRYFSMHALRTERCRDCIRHLFVFVRATVRVLRQLTYIHNNIGCVTLEIHMVLGTGRTRTYFWRNTEWGGAPPYTDALLATFTWTICMRHGMQVTTSAILRCAGAGTAMAVLSHAVHNDIHINDMCRASGTFVVFHVRRVQVAAVSLSIQRGTLSCR